MPKAYIYEVLLNVDTVKKIIDKTSLISRPSLRIINKPVDFINKPCFSKCRTVKECRFVLEETKDSLVWKVDTFKVPCKNLM